MDCDCEDDEPEFGQPGSIDNPMIRAKWSVDGATTLAEAADQARQFAASLDALNAQGWELSDVISDDYGFTHWVGEGEPVC